MKCAQCEQATIELALIKIEIDAWLEAERDGLGQISAAPRIRRIAKRFEGFELLEHPETDQQPPRIELSFPPDRAYFSPRDLLELGRESTPAPRREAEPPAQRSSMRTLFEFRTRGWIKWLVLPLAWALSVFVAWWVIH